MSEIVDLREALKSWPYDPENDARVVHGEDGRDILQVRTPVGIEQMELDGRPDGTRPHGMESALEFQLKRLTAAQASGKETKFELAQPACVELFNEGTLYYMRYVRLFQLRDWPRTIRDTTRNLRVFDLVHRHAQREEDQLFLEKWRPYILRVQYSAMALAELDKGLFDKALRTTREGTKKIEDLDGLDDETYRFEHDRSLTALGELEKQIEKNRPLSELEVLEQQLHRAVDRQEFERAAKLRDQIRELKKQYIC